MRWFLILLAFLTAPLTVHGQTQGGAQQRVDLELVLAVDVSRSMDPDEQRLQILGYANAFLDPEVLTAITSGPLGRIAVTYFEWAGTGRVREIVPWTLVDGADSATQVAQILADVEPGSMRRTSISGALSWADTAFRNSPFRGTRRVVDISGDGPNNQGERVTDARDRLLDQGIVINGLPVMLRPSYSGFFDIENLDIYYEDCVIGGFGSFIVPVQDAADFSNVIRRKLVLEIAGRLPPPRLRPAQGVTMDCLIGERLWDQWFGGYE